MLFTMKSWLLIIVVILITAQLDNDCTQANIILSEVPQSRNVSARALVEFTCATEESGVTSFGITTIPPIIGQIAGLVLPSGGRQQTLSFIAPSEHNNITIVCSAIKSPDFNESTAILMIQGPLSGVGNLTSSEVDHCTLHFTWTAPYTLQGVSVDNYTVTITRHNNGTVLRSDTTNTTEYFFTMSSLGETLEVEVVAVIVAGPGDVSAHVLNATNSTFKFPIVERSRHSNGWIFESIIKTRTICDAHTKVTVHLHDESSGLMYNTTATITTLSDGRRRLVAHFNDVPEDKHYQATSKVHYDQFIQHSIPTETNTYDILHVNYTILPEAVQVTVAYVEGSVHNIFCAKLHCLSKIISNTFSGSSGMLVGVPPNELCTLMVTDDNGMSFIDTRAAVTIENITVPIATVTPSISSTNNTIVTQTTPIEVGGDNKSIIIGIGIGVPTFIILAAATLLVMTVCFAKLFRPSRSRTKESKPVSQSQESAQFTEVVKKPALVVSVPINIAELYESDSEEPPLVPPHTADSEVLNPSTSQPPNKSQNEKLSHASKPFQAHTHFTDVSSDEPSPFQTQRGNQIKTNCTGNEMAGPIYQQPSQENNPPLSPPHRKEAIDPDKQPQYADMAILNQTPRETNPQQPPDAGLVGTVYSTINHTAT